MFCPRCAADVGDKVKLCDRCISDRSSIEEPRRLQHKEIDLAEINGVSWTERFNNLTISWRFYLAIGLLMFSILWVTMILRTPYDDVTTFILTAILAGWGAGMFSGWMIGFRLFHHNFLWGLASFIVPGAGVIYAFSHREEFYGLFSLGVIGGVLFLGGIITLIQYLNISPLQAYMMINFAFRGV